MKYSRLLNNISTWNICLRITEIADINVFTRILLATEFEGEFNFFPSFLLQCKSFFFISNRFTFKRSKDLYPHLLFKLLFRTASSSIFWAFQIYFLSNFFHTSLKCYVCLRSITTTITRTELKHDFSRENLNDDWFS